MSGSIRWLGHAFVEFTTAEGKVVLFDPWTKDGGNPSCPFTIDEIERADLVLISHDHFDHMSAAAAICKKTGALLGGPVQTVKKLIAEGLSDQQVVNFGFGYMIGGGVDLDWVKVRAIPAFHSSETACPLGNIVITPDGTTVYHSGDTGIFSDMGLYARLYPMTAAFVPIGGVFTMDAFQASEAVKLLSPKTAFPIHYGSFPIVAGSADEFLKLCALKAPSVKAIAPKVGERVNLP